MLLYIQQLEEHVRQLTGDNERLAYEVNKLRAQLGLPPLAVEPGADGRVDPGPAPAGDAAAADGRIFRRSRAAGADAASRCCECGLTALAPTHNAPVDLSTLAGGTRAPLPAPGAEAAAPAAPAEPPTDTAWSPRRRLRRQPRSPARRATNTISPTATS